MLEYLTFSGDFYKLNAKFVGTFVYEDVCRKYIRVG